MDVGQGDCTVAVDHVAGEGVLIDCRSGYHEYAVAELDRLGCLRLRAAVVTHSQQDHFGGVLDALESLSDRFDGVLYFNQDSLMAVPAAAGDRRAAGRRLRALINRARELEDRVARAEISSDPEYVGDIAWRLLAPTYQDVLAAIASGNPNLASGVVLIESGRLRMLICGDAPVSIWERIADEVPRQCIVRWPHHGGSVGASTGHARIREILDPAAVIVSVGTDNPHGHPSIEFFAATGGGTVRLLCTQATSTCAGSRLSGPCAGTVRVCVQGDDAPAISPNVEEHQSVIAKFPHAQCLPSG